MSERLFVKVHNPSGELRIGPEDSKPVQATGPCEVVGGDIVRLRNGCGVAYIQVACVGVDRAVQGINGCMVALSALPGLRQ